MELEGSPDLTIEVVSKTSVRKDTVRLPIGYHQAGVGEFWLVDARGETVSFEIFLRAEAGNQSSTTGDGWKRSPLLRHDFRLSQKADPLGRPLIQVEPRPS